MNCVNISHPEFKELAKSLNLDEDILEEIVHDYQIQNKTDKFPSKEYVNSKLDGTNSEFSDAQLTLWNQLYSKDIVLNSQEALDKAVDEALNYFPKEAITEFKTLDGKFKMRVTRPNVTKERLRAMNHFRKDAQRFLDNFGITVEDMQSYEGGPVQLFDALNKAINASSVEDISEGVGEAIAFMMMHSNKVKDLIAFKSIQDDSAGYKNFRRAIKRKGEFFRSKKATQRELAEIYKNPEARNRYLKAIGQDIALELRKFYDLESTPEEKSNSWIGEIWDIIMEFFDKLTPRFKTSISVMSNTTKQIAEAVKLNDPSIVLESLSKPGSDKETTRVTLDNAFKENKYEENIISSLNKYNIALAGSASIAMEGTLYRPAENPLHDIDFSSPNENKESLQKILTDEFKNVTHIRTIGNATDAITETFLTVDRPFNIVETKRWKSLGKNKYARIFEVQDKETGEVLGEYYNSELSIFKEGVKAKFLDFFTGKGNGKYPPKTFNINGKDYLFGDYRAAMEAKISWVRDKDIWDYTRFMSNEQAIEMASREAQRQREIADKVKGANIIWGHPAIGKSTYLQNHDDFLDTDEEILPLMSEFIRQQVDPNHEMSETEFMQAKKDYRAHMKDHPELTEWLINAWNDLKVRAKKEGKKIFTSNITLLNTNLDDFDIVVALNNRDFLRNSGLRGTHALETTRWKQNIDNTLARLNTDKLIYTDKFFSDFMDLYNDDEGDFELDENAEKSKFSFDFEKDPKLIRLKKKFNWKENRGIEITATLSPEDRQKVADNIESYLKSRKHEGDTNVSIVNDYIPEGKSTTIEVLDNIINKSKDKNLVELAKKIKSRLSVDRTVVGHTKNKKRGLRGQFTTDNIVHLFAEATRGTSETEARASFEHTTLHEITHSVTSDGLAKDKALREAVSEVMGQVNDYLIQNNIVDNTDNTSKLYFFKNEKEFMSEFMSSPVLREALKHMEYKGEGKVKKTLFRKVLDAVLNFFGIKPKSTLYQRAEQLFDDVSKVQIDENYDRLEDDSEEAQNIIDTTLNNIKNIKIEEENRYLDRNIEYTKRKINRYKEIIKGYNAVNEGLKQFNKDTNKEDIIAFIKKEFEERELSRGGYGLFHWEESINSYKLDSEFIDKIQSQIDAESKYLSVDRNIDTSLEEKAFNKGLNGELPGKDYEVKMIDNIPVVSLYYYNGSSDISETTYWRINNGIPEIAVAGSDEEIKFKKNDNIKEENAQIYGYLASKNTQNKQKDSSTASSSPGVQVDRNLKQNYKQWQKDNPQGIVAYRVNYNKYNTPEEALAGRIGNPFSDGVKGLETVKKFYTWITKGYTFGNEKATEEYRQAIIKRLQETPEDAPVLYYTVLDHKSHADVLAYLIKHKELLNPEPPKNIIQRHQGNWTREEAQNNPKNLYIFTDNTDRSSGQEYIDMNSRYYGKYNEVSGKPTRLKYPTTTSAVIRGLDNAMPLSTQRWYNKKNKGITGRWNDVDANEFEKVIKSEVDDIIEEFQNGNYENIIVPEGGFFNSKIADISKDRTPKLYSILLHELNRLNREVNNIAGNTIVQTPTPRAQKANESAEVEKAKAALGKIKGFSGAADGADTMWRTLGEKFLGEWKDYLASDMDRLKPEWAKEVEDAYQQAAKDLGRPIQNASSYVGKLVRRDYLQVKSADGVFAVAPIIGKGKKNAKGYINKAKYDSVDGGTGYAVQMAINMGKPVNVFNTLDNKWYKWDYSTNKFIEQSTPILTEKFAGIGSRNITEQGIQAIKDVYRKTVDNGGPVEAKSNASLAVKTAQQKTAVGQKSVDKTIKTLNEPNSGLLENEKKSITKIIGNKPLKVLTASEHTDPILHAKEIKKMVEEELKKPADQRTFHMMYLITKHDGLPLKELAGLKIPKFIHFSITSLGGTKWEPGVMKTDDLLDRIESFIKDGTLNPNLITIRVDPIVPGVTTQEDVRHIVERSKAMGIKNFKFSIMDSYGYTENTTKDRFIIQQMEERGYNWDEHYNTEKRTVEVFDKKLGKKVRKEKQVVSFNAKNEVVSEWYHFMDDLATEFGIRFNTCGEQPKFISGLKNINTNVGCVNVKTLNDVMGTNDITDIQGKQRPECSCYGNQIDALRYDDVCGSSCVYCYAGHGSEKEIQYYDKNGKLRDTPLTRTEAKIEQGKTNPPSKDTTIDIGAFKKNGYEGLSNFAPRPITTLDGKTTFNSVEQAFQASKIQHLINFLELTGHKDTKAYKEAKVLFNDIMASENGLAAKKLGGTKIKSRGKKIQEDIDRFFNSKDLMTWNTLKERQLKSIMKLSFEQNPEAKKLLLSTGDATLTHTVGDREYKVLFPKLLTEIREEFKHESKSAEPKSLGEVISPSTEEGVESLAEEQGLPDISTRFQTKMLDRSRVEIEYSHEPWKDDASKTKHSIKVYLKGQKDKGYFELVADTNFDNTEYNNEYSVHFKTGNPDTGELYGSTSKERKILYAQIRDLIPPGAKVSTWGYISDGGIKALEKVGKDWQTVGTRTIKDREGNPLEIPIYQKPSTKEMSKTERFIEAQSKVQAQMNTLLDSNLITNTEIGLVAREVVFEISSLITELQNNPETAITELSKKVDLDKLKKARNRNEIAQVVGAENLINYAKEIFASTGNKYSLPITRLKANVLNANWDAVMTMAQPTFTLVENFTINTIDGDINKVDNTKNPDDFNNPTDLEAIQELQGSLQEHWQVESRTLDTVEDLTDLLRTTFNGMPLLKITGYKEDGSPVTEPVKNEFGGTVHLTLREVTTSLLKWFEGAQDIKDMKDILDAQEEKNPWVIPINKMLKDESGTYSDFQSQFFTKMHKLFQLFDVITDDGTLSVINANKNPATYDVIKSIKASYAIKEHPMFTSQGVNQTTLNTLKENAKIITDYNKAGDKTKTSKDTLAEALGAVYRTLGFGVDKELVLKAISDEALSELTKPLNYLIKSLENHVEDAEYNPFEYNTNEGEKNDYITSNLRRIISPVAEIMEETGVKSTYDNGKMYQSYVIPSYVNNLFIKFHTADQARFDKFIEEEYGKYPWFRFQESDMSEGWRNSWMGEMYNDPEARFIFDHKVNLSMNKKNYMRNMNELEYTLSVLAEYWSEGAKTKEARVPAWFRVTILSNKPSSEFIKFYSERGADYKEVLLDKFKDVFDQELSRIQTVRLRGRNKEDADFLKAYDNADRGGKFVTLDFLNPYLTNAKLKKSKLGIRLAKKIAGKKLSTKNENILYDEVRKVIKDTIDSKVSQILEEWSNNGVLKVATKKIEGITKQNALNNFENFIWNDTFAQIMIQQITITDPAFNTDTDDTQKRVAQIHAPGNRANKYARDYNGNLVSDGVHRNIVFKDFRGVISSARDNVIEVFNRKIATAPAHLKDSYTALRDNIAEQFSDINVTDAQAYSSITSYRKKAFMFGTWSKEAEKVYNNLKQGTYTFSDLRTAFQPLKPFVYTQNETSLGDNVPLNIQKVPIQDKNAEYLLIMADALLQGEETSKPNLLRIISEVMEESADGRIDGIDTAQFNSAVKSGESGTIDLNQFTEGDAAEMERLAKEYLLDNIYSDANTHTYNTTVVKESDFENFAIQQDVPAHFRGDEQAHPSQERYITVSDLGDATYEVEGRQLSGKEFKAEFESTIRMNIDESLENLRTDLNLDADTEYEKNAALSAILQKEILSSPRYGIDLWLACSIDKTTGDFLIPKGDPIQAKRIEQLCNSIVKNRVNKQELPGGPVVQVSNFGMSRQLNIVFKDKNNKGAVLFTKENYGKQNNLAGKELDDAYKTYIADNQGGIAYFECFAPIYSEELFTKFADADGNIDIAAIEATDPELLKMIGVRIPSEDKFSIIPLKIVGFVPREAGEAVMLPYDITTITGSDFDKISMLK